MKGFLIWLLGAIILVGVPFTYANHAKSEHPDFAEEIENEIQEVVEIEDFDYKFEKFKFGLFSGAGAGGQGAAIMWMQTPESFVDNLNEGEKIFTEVKLGEKKQIREDNYAPVVEKIYIAGVENRAHLIGYKDVYIPPVGYTYKAHNDNFVAYKYDLGQNGVHVALILMASIIGVVWLFGGLVALDNYSY